MSEKSENIYYGLIKGIVIGLICMIVALWFMWEMVGNPFDELALIRKAETTNCTLIDSYIDETEGYRGKVFFADVGIYSFFVSDGSEFKAIDRAPLGKLKEYQEVEYLPDNPKVNRIKGEGCQSITEWLWRKIGIGSFLLLMFLSIGFIVLKSSIIKFRCRKIRLDVEHIFENVKDLTENQLKEKIEYYEFVILRLRNYNLHEDCSWHLIIASEMLKSEEIISDKEFVEKIKELRKQ